MLFSQLFWTVTSQPWVAAASQNAQKNVEIFWDFLGPWGPWVAPLNFDASKPQQFHEIFQISPMMPLAAGEKKTTSTPRRPNIFPSPRNHYPKSGTTFESGEFFEHTTGVNWDVNYEHLLHPSAEVVIDLLMKLWSNQEMKRFRTIEYLGFCQPWSDRSTVWAEIGWTLACLILWKLVPPGIRSFVELFTAWEEIWGRVPNNWLMVSWTCSIFICFPCLVCKKARVLNNMDVSENGE